MGLLKEKEKKGFRCRENPDGSETCERIVKDKSTGEILGDGQEATFSADQSTGCKPRIVGEMTIFDDEFGNFDEIAGRVSKSCKKN